MQFPCQLDAPVFIDCTTCDGLSAVLLDGTILHKRLKPCRLDSTRHLFAIRILGIEQDYLGKDGFMS